MKARPILFRGEMVRALLSGQKTMTRRVVKPEPLQSATRFEHFDGPRWRAYDDMSFMEWATCPYGTSGDLLWVRETWTTDNAKLRFRADYEEIGHDKLVAGRWKPSIHMPRWASRLTLRITDVRVERLQDISREDAVAEGCVSPLKGTELEGVPGDYVADERTSFAILWKSINGPESWSANPFVWVVEFEVIQANVDQVLKEAVE